MKKPLILFTAIWFIASTVYPQSKVNKNNLILYGDKWYKSDEDEPFTGIVFDISKVTGNRILKSKYVQGLPNGKHIEWDKEGHKRVEGNYKRGIKDGKWTWYNEDGTTDSEGNFVNGIQDGKWVYYTEWYGNDQIYSEETFRYGIQDGLCTYWYKNGQKMGEETYRDGKQDGVWTFWYDNGQKEEEGTLKNGEYHGRLIGWYSNGRNAYEWLYEDGDLIDGKCWDSNGVDCDCDNYGRCI